MERYLSRNLATLYSLCKLDPVASHPRRESVPEGGVQRSRSVIKSVTFEKQPTLYSPHHGQRQQWPLIEASAEVIKV